MSSGIPGSGAGAGTPPPTIFELDTSAAVFVARSNLGIAQDSLARPLNEMDRPRMWKYTSEPWSPFIMPLNRLRVLMRAENQVSEVWTRAFQKLVEMLSNDAHEALMREIRLPPELRNPAFGSLDRILGWIALAMAWIDTSIEVTTDQQRERVDDLYVGMLPTAIAAGAQNSLDVVAGCRDFLNQVGHADSNFDRLLGIVDHLEQYAHQLRE